ncbi:hypothetical protein WJS89_10495 [Sphingomicrobium sp. XHP0235]|uniref:hypothetical protein n=1 Tax=Sphingomicrobium aquimarinum TaxID=3133971 RepID=UPI0031FF0E15
MGRPKRKGNRSPSGRLKKATTTAEREKRDTGSERTAKRIARFNAMKYQGGGHGKESVDAAGILFLTGNLDHFDYEPQKMLEAFRDYDKFRQAWLAAVGAPKAVGGSDMEPKIRTTGEEHPRHEWMAEKFDAIEKEIGVASPRHRTLMGLMFDGRFCPNDLGIPDWVQRFLNEFEGQATQWHNTPGANDHVRLGHIGQCFQIMCELTGAQKKKRAA